MDKRRTATLVVLLIAVGVAILVLWGEEFSAILVSGETDPIWEEVYTSGSGITVSGTVIYSKGKEFILDVIREDAPTLRAPSLYYVGANTKIWKKNRWKGLNKAPKVGEVVMMHVPFSQEPTGIYINQDYQYVQGNIDCFDENSITIQGKAYNLVDAYVDSKVNKSLSGAFAVIATIDDKVEYAAIWPEEITELPKLIKASRSRWEDEHFVPSDIQVLFDEGWIITGFEYPFKNQLNEAKQFTYSRDGTLKGTESFLPLDDFEMQVRFEDKIYQNTWETKILTDLQIVSLKIAGKDYNQEIYYYLGNQRDFLYTKSWQEGLYTVWKEVVSLNGDSTSNQPN